MFIGRIMFLGAAAVGKTSLSHHDVMALPRFVMAVQWSNMLSCKTHPVK